jgi:hypothetical protein
VPELPPWGQDIHQLDRLLTLSCSNFLQSLLSSVVFEPGIPCNCCGAWIQGTFAALDKVQPILQVLAGALMARNPKLGFLWLGATLLGLHDFVLRWMRALFYPLDLTLAGWTDTLMSFIQERVADPVVVNEAVARADEARLLFLSQAMNHKQPPIVAFQPFGFTLLVDCGLEVREHAQCRGKHGLYYSGWAWNCRDTRTEADHTPQSYDSETMMNALISKPDVLENDEADDVEIIVDYSQMNREKDPSETVTRSIFMWLRETDGFPNRGKEDQRTRMDRQSGGLRR